MTGSDGGFARISPKWRSIVREAVQNHRSGIVRDMAQDQRPRHLYVIECGGFVKVGFATHLEDRLQAIRVACPLDATLAHSEAVGRWYAAAAEKGAHAALAPCLHRGEWFRAPVQIAVDVVKEAAECARGAAERARIIADADRRYGIRRDAKGRPAAALSTDGNGG